MKIASYDIVFQDVPGEVTLSLNLSQCPNCCHGCHSPQLQEDIGYTLDEELLDGLLERYGRDVTCVCFMGGDREPDKVMQLADHVHAAGLKTAWYSGRQDLPDCFRMESLDYVKVGPYIESKGPLPSPDTNQRMYRIENGQMIDITASFRKKGVGR
ncbi:MAG: anaerobic ribonucleoside-triphosphate reductase activating protein [Bacteroidaceae bacterium]|nr:anaerobic ribonucleoside-triphosphate reductase activating protein [Bacteroidaceae bacterium]